MKRTAKELQHPSDVLDAPGIVGTLVDDDLAREIVDLHRMYEELDGSLLVQAPRWVKV